MTTPAMPELPEPFALSVSVHEGDTPAKTYVECMLYQKHPNEKQRLYTADQMRAYALAALSSQPSPEQAGVSDACTAPTIEAAREMGAKGGPVVEAERLAFEAWMAGHCWKVSPTWNGQTYDDSEEDKNRGLLDPLARTTRMLWAAWRDRAALRPAQQAVPMTCTWVEDDETGNYATTCGHVFALNDGGPADNGMKFCCYCGGGITAQGAQGEQE